LITGLKKNLSLVPKINIKIKSYLTKSHDFLIRLKDLEDYRNKNTMAMPVEDPMWEDARVWFNKMEINSRNQMILTMYKLCLGTKDTSHEKLAESLNNQWNEKLNKYLEQQRNLVEANKRLVLENDVLGKNRDATVGTLTSALKDLELNINSTMHSISNKISPNSNGKLGEDYIDELLGKIPNTELTNRTQARGGGDFLFKTGGIRIMIESKNWTNSSIKGNPKELENFRQTAIAAREEDSIDFAIMALHRVTDLKGKALEIEMVFTKRGRLMLLYVTNLFNHPERICYAIDAGLLLLTQQSQQSVDSDKFLYQVDNFMKGIGRMEESVKEHNKLIREMTQLIKKDSDQIMTLKQMLENILSNTDQLPMKERVINYCSELITENGEAKVTKVMLENKLLEHKIPCRWVREFGGIKILKNLALKLNQSESESESEEDVEESDLDEEGSDIEEESDIEN